MEMHCSLYKSPRPPFFKGGSIEILRFAQDDMKGAQDDMEGTVGCHNQYMFIITQVLFHSIFIFLIGTNLGGHKARPYILSMHERIKLIVL